MNSATRIAAALTGEPTDRRGVNLVLSLYGARLTGAPLDRHFTDPATYALGTSAL